MAAQDTVCSLTPCFTITNLEKFKEHAAKCIEITKTQSGVVNYGLSISQDGTQAHCREAYTSAQAVLDHVAGVMPVLSKLLEEGATLDSIQCHGPASEIDKLKGDAGLNGIGCVFFSLMEGSFRN